MKDKIIVGLAGEVASGKGTVAEYLVTKHCGVKYRFSDVLKNILDRVHLDHVRENFASLSLALRTNFGEDILASALSQDIENDDSKVIVVDGVRRPADLKYLREFDNFIFVFVEADMKTRYERLTKRHEKDDDQTKTFEQFKKDQELETEQTISELKGIADVVIDNNGTIDKLYKQVDKLIEERKVC